MESNNTIFDSTNTDIRESRLDVGNIFKSLNVGTFGVILLITAAAVLIHDAIVYLLASTSSRKRLLVTPWLIQIAADSWEDLSQRSTYARSDQVVGPVLRSLADTAKKYEGRWEKSRLL
ncbi:uncharacterized protein LOC135219379 [Macrobrachium nipponense]|uniref:uncharacterized protein LOC135219379 n=1 Tax=Macrobrachium nipponense TaxID=159736 RepID=UPI0030C83999